MPFDGVESPCRYLEKFDQVIDLIENPKKVGQTCLHQSVADSIA